MAAGAPASAKRDLVLDLIVDGREDLPLRSVACERRRLLDGRHRVRLVRALDALREEAATPLVRRSSRLALYSRRVIAIVAPELTSCPGAAANGRERARRRAERAPPERSRLAAVRERRRSASRGAPAHPLPALDVRAVTDRAEGQRRELACFAPHVLAAAPRSTVVSGMFRPSCQERKFPARHEQRRDPGRQQAKQVVPLYTLSTPITVPSRTGTEDDGKCVATAIQLASPDNTDRGLHDVLSPESQPW